MLRHRPSLVRRSVSTLALGLLLAAAGCRAAKPAAESTARPGEAPTETMDSPAEEAAEAGWPASKVPADTLVLVATIEPASLDPSWTYESGGASIARMLYSTLVAFEREKPDAFVPALATEWTVSDDGLTYTFTLRDGVTFHEGGTLEPHDVAYTFQRALLEDRSGGPMWLYLSPFLGTNTITSFALDQAGIEVAAGEEAPALDALPAEALTATCEAVQAAVRADDDAGTVTIRLAQRTPWWLQLLAMPHAGILDQEWMVENGDWDGTCKGWTEWHDPAAEDSPIFDRANGTGPYRLGAWKKNESVTLDAWDGYWQTEPAWEGAPTGPARIRHVVLQNVPEWGTRFAKLRAGEADSAYVPLAEIDQLEDMIHAEHVGGFTEGETSVVDPEGTLMLYRDFPVATAAAITFNFDIGTAGGNEFVGSGALDGDGIPPGFFSDIDVRRGFIQCFDTETYIRDAMQGDAIPARGPIISGLQGYRPDSPLISFDIDACRASLAAAMDGALPDVGFRMIVPYAEGWAESETALAILADGLARANPLYRLETVQMSWPTLLDNIGNRRLPLAMTGWYEDYHDPSNWAFTYLHSDGANSGPQNFPPELADRLDPLVDAAAVESDPEKRDVLYAALQALAIDNATAIFINQGLGRAYWRREVQGLYVNALAPGTDFYSLSKTAASP